MALKQITITSLYSMPNITLTNLPQAFIIYEQFRTVPDRLGININQ